MAKIVKCKTCKADIAKTARVCPYCGARQHTGAHVASAIIIVIAIFLIIGIIGSSGGNTPHKVNDSSPEKKVETLQTTTPKETEQTVFSVGDKVELNNIIVSLVSVSTNNGHNYMNPGSGNEFIVCEFEIENNSSKDIAVSSMLSFDAYVDDYSANLSLSAMISTDKTQLDGTVAAGKKMNGVIGYEVSTDWQVLEIRFAPDFWSGKKIVFKARNQ